MTNDRVLDELGYYLLTAPMIRRGATPDELEPIVTDYRDTVA